MRIYRDLSFSGHTDAVARIIDSFSSQYPNVLQLVVDGFLRTLGLELNRPRQFYSMDISLEHVTALSLCANSPEATLEHFGHPT